MLKVFNPTKLQLGKADLNATLVLIIGASDVETPKSDVLRGNIRGVIAIKDGVVGFTLVQNGVTVVSLYLSVAGIVTEVTVQRRTTVVDMVLLVLMAVHETLHSKSELAGSKDPLDTLVCEDNVHFVKHDFQNGKVDNFHQNVVQIDLELV